MKIYIAENIRNLRKKYNMKQEQLAEALDVSITAVSKWEREMTTPELKYIVEMADLFEVSVDALLGYDIQSGVCEALEKRIHDLQMKKDYESAQIEAEKALVKYQYVYDVTNRMRCNRRNLELSDFINNDGDFILYGNSVNDRLLE